MQRERLPASPRYGYAGAEMTPLALTTMVTALLSGNRLLCVEINREPWNDSAPLHACERRKIATWGPGGGILPRDRRRKRADGLHPEAPRLRATLRRRGGPRFHGPLEGAALSVSRWLPRGHHSGTFISGVPQRPLGGRPEMSS